MQDTPAPPASESVPGQGQLYARIKTSMGDMVAKLFEAEAPRTVANFVGLATGNVEWTDPRTNEKTMKETNLTRSATAPLTIVAAVPAKTSWKRNLA